MLVGTMLGLVSVYIGQFHNNLCSRISGISYASALVIMVLLLIWVVFQKPSAVSGERPVIHVWTHNGNTGVCAEADYAIACRAMDRIVIAGNAKWMIPIPRPILMAYFSDRSDAPEELGDFLTGSMTDYRNLINHCLIRTSKMLVPESPERSHGLPIDFTTLCRLVFGRDNEKPKSLQQ